MPSPFKVFRKRQKLMIAILGLLAMIAFVVLPIVMKNMGMRRVANPRVVSTTRYGDLHEIRLARMRQNRGTLLGFLKQLQAAVEAAGGNSTSVRLAIQTIGTTGEEDVVNSWLLAKRAEELGLVVDDTVVNRYITALIMAEKIDSEPGRQGQKIRVPDKQVKKILDTLRISGDNLLDLLKPELMAAQLQQMFHVSLRAVPPAQRWDYYQRLNRKVAIEAVPIPVAKYVTEVATPDDAALRQFFEEHKGNLAHPRSPEFGFREPHRIAVQYFKAEPDNFIELDAVTEDEIKAEYEETKDIFYREEKLPGLDDQPPAATGPAEDAAGQNPPGESPAETPAQNPAPDEPQEPAPAESPRTPPAEQTPPGPADSGDTSSLSVPPPFRLASFQQEGEPAEPPEPETTPAEAPSTETTPPEAPSTETTPTEAPSTETTPPEAPSTETTPTEPPPTETTPPEAPSTETTPPEAPSTETTPPEPPPTETTPAEEPAGESIEEIVDSVVGKYVPLEKVKDEIRRRLARKKTAAKIEEVLGRLRNRMTEYERELILYRVMTADKKQGEGPPPPAKLDFRALAKKNGLTAHKTALISALEAADKDIARSIIDGQTLFLYYAYDNLPEYRPEISRDHDGNYYLFWNIQDSEERVPEFEEEGVKKRVLSAWKMLRARKLAEDAAEGLAAEARKAKKSLVAAFAGKPGIVVNQTEPFSWRTYGTTPPMLAQAPPRISLIKKRMAESASGEQQGGEAVVMPGDDFMRTVFSLSEGQIGLAMNEPKTAVYVVRVQEINPLPKVLWDGFVAEDYFSYFRVGYYDQIESRQAWLDQIKAEVGFKWERLPRQVLARR